MVACEGPQEAVIKYHKLSIIPSNLMPWPLITMIQTPPIAPVIPSIRKKTIDNFFLDCLFSFELFNYSLHVLIA